MEALFRPTTRFRDSLRNSGGHLPKGFTEVELLPGLTVENVRATGVTWEDFHRFLRYKIVWITSEVFVGSGLIKHRGYPMFFAVGGGGTRLVVRVVAANAEATATVSATCNFAVRLLATYERPGLYINGRDNVSSPISGAGLSLFFQESRESLRQVTLECMVLNEDQCLALATMSRVGVKLEILGCSLSNDAAGAFVECLQSDRGPVELIRCNIESQVLTSALTGNSRVTKFQPIYKRVRNNADMAILFAALFNRRGPVNLDISRFHMSHDNWSFLCESLKAHPTLTSLDLRNTMPWRRSCADASVVSDEEKSHRTRLLAETMKENITLHTVHLSEDERDEQIYKESILPYLGMNLYRPRVLAMNKVDISLRRAFLGRALQTDSVRNDSNLLWMFLSGNPGVVA
jgi:hypothetical protein